MHIHFSQCIHRTLGLRLGKRQTSGLAELVYSRVKGTRCGPIKRSIQ
jgi:hypothetical protein